MRPEIPPSAGLPLLWRDLRPASAVDFEQRIAEFLRVPAVQLECSGTASLIVALTALRELSPRRTVIIPAFTCPLVPLAIACAGLRVQLCDLAATGFDLDYGQLARLCDEDTLAVVPTHLAGRVADIAAATACARRVGAWIIEDAAQAFGARYGDRSVGELGDIGFFSLAAGKGLTIYEGGVLYARDPVLRAQLRYVSHRMIHDKPLREWGRALQLIAYAALYRPRGLSLAYGMPLHHALRRNDLLAAVGDDVPRHIPLHRVGRWRSAVGARALVRLRLFQELLTVQGRHRVLQLNAIAGLKVFGDAPAARGTWPCLLVLMPSMAARDAALERLWGAGVGLSRLFIRALPDYPALVSLVPVSAVPVARAFAARSLTISNSLWLGPRQFESICAVLHEVTASVPTPESRSATCAPAVR